MMATLLKPARNDHAAWRDEARQHFASADVRVSAQDVAVMDAVVSAVNELVASPVYRDRVLAEADSITRRDYELRASRSQPGLEATPEPPQLTRTAGD